jgi:N-acetylglucosaminylphosphatidylinositol deacetylase
MTLYYIALSFVGFLVCCVFLSITCASSLPASSQLCNKKILLLIGHPDDEAMFFGPSVLALTSPGAGNQVKILCLSTGNAVGLGKVRKGELLDSARRIGIHRARDVYIVDDPRLQDGPDDWKKEDIADCLAQHFLSEQTAKSTACTSSAYPPSPVKQLHQSAESFPLSTGEPNTLPVPDIILTFDPRGISLHPNHSSCHYLDTVCNTQTTMYSLTTISWIRKYLSAFDAPITRLNTLFNKPHPTPLTSTTSTSPDSLIFVSGLRDYARAFGAMVFAHKTQMLWFRWGWIITGRYMFVNDLRRVDVSKARTQ